jgi:hypothetical protein
MLVKTLSVQQPYATLICAGVKTVENRSWKTDYRGRLLIHASGSAYAYPDLDCLPENFQKKLIECDAKNNWSKASQEMRNYMNLLGMADEFFHVNEKKKESPTWLKDAVKKYGVFLPSQTIVGEVALFDIITNSKDDFAEPDCFHWILTDPVFYENPIINVLGHLRLWEFDLELDHIEER